MPYDLFISYSRRDNERGQVAALKSQIETSFRAFAGRNLRVFFDTHEIAGMDDWRQKIQRSLRDSQVFLAVLSPHYLASPYCRWEWEDYVRYEAMRQCLGEGVAPVFFVTLPDTADPKTDQAVARWIDEIQRRQTFDLRPWHDAGEQALQQAHVRQTLEQLHASVRERLDRAERSRNSPNNLIKHNSAFVGRVRELTDLRHALTKNKLGVVGAREGQMPGRATVQGLGGMGKTELALAYAHAFAWDYPGGRWQIPCERVSDLRVALRHLANANALNFEFKDDEKKNLAAAFERVLRELNQRERCLLILDNVSDPNLLQPEHLDRLPRDGRVDIIATTRLAPSHIPGSVQEQTFIAVDELPEEDALALMRSHQPEGRFASQQEDEEAQAIVRLLRGFTLAVETAAIYLGRNTTNGVCRRFRERLSPDLLRESEAAATDPAVAVRHRVRSLEETLAITLETLTPEAIHLLEIASLLPADQIALPWLNAVGAVRFPAFSSEPPSAFQQAEELLLGLRLFQRGGEIDDDGRLLVARMHRLVQDLVRSQRANKIGGLEKALFTHINHRAREISKAWHESSQRWEVFATASSLQVFLVKRDLFLAEATNSIGVALARQELPVATEDIFRAAISTFCEVQQGQHAARFITTHHLAEYLGRIGRYAEAIALCREAMEGFSQVLGPTADETLQARNDLGWLMGLCGNYSEATSIFEQLLSAPESDVRASQQWVCDATNNLALSRSMLGDEEGAELLYRKNLESLEWNSGPNHPDTLLAAANLGHFLVRKGDFFKAQDLFQRALDGMESSGFGASHSQTRSIRFALAGSLLLHRKAAEAKEHFLRILSELEQASNKDESEVQRVKALLELCERMTA